MLKVKRWREFEDTQRYLADMPLNKKVNKHAIETDIALLFKFLNGSYRTAISYYSICGNHINIPPFKTAVLIFSSPYLSRHHIDRMPI